MPRKRAHKRNKSRIQPERVKRDDPLYRRVVEFVENFSSLALDDSHDRQVLIDNLVDFVEREKVRTGEIALKSLM